MTTEIGFNTAKRLLIVANEDSSNAERARTQLEAVDLPRIVIPIMRDPEQLHDILYELVRDNDVVVGAGGDGSSRFVGSILVGTKAHESGLSAVPFLPVAGGYANDLATMINGHLSPKKILKKGHLIALSPLEITVESKEDVSQKYAFSYFGVGGTAAASQAIEDLKSSYSRLAHNPIGKLGCKALASLDAVANYPYFVARNDRDGEVVIISDYSFLNGNRIARFGRPHADLTERQFEAVYTLTKGTLSTLGTMIKMRRGRLYGSFENRMEIVFDSINELPIAVHYDGEATQIPHGSRVTVAASKKKYRTITTRL